MLMLLFLFVSLMLISTRNSMSAYLKAGLDAGTKAEAEAKQAAMQKTVFIVSSQGRL
jgi:hypothetical protein